MKNKWRFLLKMAVSLLLLAWVLSKTDLAALREALGQCRPSFLVGAFSLHLVGLVVSVVRWSVLLQALGIEAPLAKLFRSYLVGFFFNTFLPSTIGGDISRSLDLKSGTVSGTQSLAVIFVERFSGVAAMIFLALVALPFAREVIPSGYWIPQIVIALFVCCLLFAGGVLLPQIPRLLGGQNRLALFHGYLAAYAHHLPSLGLAFFLGLLLQVNVIFFNYLLCLAIGFPLPLLFLFIVIPILKVILLLPISLNGIGLRENAFVHFFQGTGMGVAKALTLSWLDFGMMLLLSLLGGVVYVARKESARAR